ncbi:hypothetical protein IKI14_03470 [bacterium]|nr:hypothetical protein [bacterium]
MFVEIFSSFCVSDLLLLHPPHHPLEPHDGLFSSSIHFAYRVISSSTISFSISHFSVSHSSLYHQSKVALAFDG